MGDKPLALSADQLKSLVERKAAPVIDLLRQESFKVHAWEATPSELGLIVAFNAGNQEVAREIRLAVVEIDKELSVVVTITRTPRCSINDQLIVRDFALRKRPDLEERLFDVDQAESFEAELERLICLYRGLLSDVALPVLRGHRWETGHYPDWTLRA